MHPANGSRLGVLQVALVGAACLALAAFDPATTWWCPDCPLHTMTGWLCPFCGSLRAVHALLRGELLAAWSFNPLLMVALGAWLLARERTTAFCFSAPGLALVAGFGLLRNF